MPRTAFLVTSVIDPSAAPLYYTPTRSIFTAAERFRQTQYTIACIDRMAPPDSTIFLLEASPTDTPWRADLDYQKNLVYIPIKDQYPAIYDAIRTHPNKSHGECLMLSAFLNDYHDRLSAYTHCFKMSGRYFIDGSFRLQDLTDAGPYAIAFKRPISWEWKDSWQYEMVDRRREQGDNILHQYCSVLFGWTVRHQYHMLDVFRNIAVTTGLPENGHYDSETLLYFLTRPYATDIIETDWMTYGWGGPNGMFLRA